MFGCCQERRVAVVVRCHEVVVLPRRQGATRDFVLTLLHRRSYSALAPRNTLMRQWSTM